MLDAKTVKDVKTALQLIDSVSYSRIKNEWTFRRGYYYRHGQTPHSFAASIEALLQKSGFKIIITEKDDIWKPFRGGAPLAQSSHFRVRGTITKI